MKKAGAAPAFSFFVRLSLQGSDGFAVKPQSP
jgi:hypothetical protein